MLQKIAVVDLETTGLSPSHHHRVIEIAICLVSIEGGVIAEYTTLVNPKRDIGPTRVHGIESFEILRAPSFEEIAGDVLGFLRQADAIAAHNVVFDWSFLKAEFERLSVWLPDVPRICTLRSLGNVNLRACCKELGVEVGGDFHQAMVDARATAELLRYICREQPELIQIDGVQRCEWPDLRCLNTPVRNRTNHRESPVGFLEKIANQVQLDHVAEDTDGIGYLGLVHRVLADRVITPEEEHDLVEAAKLWGLSIERVEALHTEYLRNLLIAAVADGTISESERRDLNRVARLLGVKATLVAEMIGSAERQMATVNLRRANEPSRLCELSGKKVCFTGTLMATIDGVPISKPLAMKIAADAGLQPVSGVSKKLDLLVVADPNTQSGKAEKAREYGIRIMPEELFWKAISIDVD